MFDKPNQPADGFRMTDALPDTLMTPSELARFQGSRCVLASRPRQNRFAANGMGFYPGQRIYLFKGSLVSRDGYYVAPPNAFAYSFIGVSTVRSYDDDTVRCVPDGAHRPLEYALAAHFAFDATLCVRMFGGSQTVPQHMSATAPTYPTKGADRA